MSDLELFTYQGRQLRTLLIDGEPWFVAADACKALTLRDTSSAMRLVDEDDRRTLHRSDTPQIWEGIAPQVQMLVVVNESGLYSLIFQSEKDAAKEFRRWLTHDVLPSIRRTGAYSTAIPKTYAEALRAAADEYDRAEAAEARARELAAPAAAWTELAEAAGDWAVSDAAKVLSRDPNITTGERRLFQFMAALGWVYRSYQSGSGQRWQAYQTQIENGRLAEKVGKPFWHEGRGEMVAGVPTVRITAKGLAELHKRLGGSGQLALVASA